MSSLTEPYRFRVVWSVCRLLSERPPVVRLLNFISLLFTNLTYRSVKILLVLWWRLVYFRFYSGVEFKITLMAVGRWLSPPCIIILVTNTRLKSPRYGFGIYGFYPELVYFLLFILFVFVYPKSLKCITPIRKNNITYRRKSVFLHNIALFAPSLSVHTPPRWPSNVIYQLLN